MHTETTRRSLLGTALVLPAIAIAAPALATKPAADSAEWERLCRHYRAVCVDQARLSTIYSEYEDRAARAAHAVSPPEEPSTLLTPEIVANPEEWNAAWTRHDAARKAWQAEKDAARAEVMGDVEEQWNVALDVREAATDAIRQYPVTSLALLREKADLLSAEYDGCLEANDGAALIADIRRLADREG